MKNYYNNKSLIHSVQFKNLSRKLSGKYLPSTAKPLQGQSLKPTAWIHNLAHVNKQSFFLVVLFSNIDFFILKIY